MPDLTGLLGYFLEDPSRLLAVVGGSGGLAHWWDRWANRARISVKVRDIGLKSVDLELENHSDKANSVGQSGRIDGVNVFGERHTYVLPVADSDRVLEPFVPRTVRFRVSENAHFLDSTVGLDYVRIKLPTARGRTPTLCCRSLDHPERMIAVLFYLRRWIYTARGRLLLRRGQPCLRGVGPTC